MRPCQYRSALDDGRIVCDKITEGSPEVNPNICRTCPVQAVNCQHLRFTLRKVGHKPIVVRFGNGASDVWDDDPPAVDLMRGACAEMVKPIRGWHDCVGCEARCAIWDDVPLDTGPLRTSAPQVANGAPGGNVIWFPRRTEGVEGGRAAGWRPRREPQYREATGTEGSAELG